MRDQKKSHIDKGFAALTLGCVGTVYGDIGTSPLYAFRESIAAASGHGGAIMPEMVMGVTSLIIWALFLIVTLKYVCLLMSADNNGEGGILSLMALIQGSIKKQKSNTISFAIVMGIAGAALFYGDSIITPAISVLSAVEGLKLLSTSLTKIVIPLSIVIMVLLFWVQRRGTSKISAFFGPIMVVWFLALGWGGLLHISDNYDILKAFNPIYGASFVLENGWAGLVALGAVFLAVTGAEALYADLGHFGKKPIRMAWVVLVMPALILNYLGQGAMVLAKPEMAENSFYLLYPEWATIPMIILATIATVIASQAVITGAFSLTHQAVQLGLLPRMKVDHTSRKQMGQIYMPQVNWLLFVGVVALLIIFKNSSALASAYGIAVTGTMVITATLFFLVLKRVWKMNAIVAFTIVLPLLLIDLTFLSANLLKFMDGGYMPVFVALILILMMNIWVKCSRILMQEAKKMNCVKELKRLLESGAPKKVSGSAVYFSSSASNAPAALLHNLKHNKVLHKNNFLLTLHFDSKPVVSEAKKLKVWQVSKDFTRISATFGYMEKTDVPKIIRMMKKRGYDIEIDDTSFFISRRHLVASAKVGAPIWQDKIFIAMASNASDAAEYFNIPKDRVVELGTQVFI